MPFNEEYSSGGLNKCTKCNLCKDRNNVVFGTGNEDADLMFIGEGPGADEDKEGIPFVGKAGKLMNQAFIGLGINRENVYIANIVKCRPPQNRVPLKEEVENCLNYLRTQVLLIKPKIINPNTIKTQKIKNFLNFLSIKLSILNSNIFINFNNNLYKKTNCYE